MIKRSLLLSAAALAAPSALFANPDIAVVETVVVESSRLDQFKSEAGTSVTVITAEDIERQGFDFALDAVASAPGVTINQNGSFGGVASVRIRGAATNHTLVLIDGIAVNSTSSPGGGFDFSRIDVENIERIEVLKGPQSTLWGSDAIGGVVSITTKSATVGLGGSAFAEYGSFNTVRNGLSVSNKTDQGDFLLSMTSISTDGISAADQENGNPEKDGYESVNFLAKGGVALPNDARVEASINVIDNRTDSDSFVFGAQGNVGDGDEYSENDEISGNLSLILPMVDGRLQNLLQVGYSSLETQRYINGAPSSDAEGDRLQYRYQGTFTANDTNKVVFGLEHETTTLSDDEAVLQSAFGAYELKPVSMVTVTAGVRVDDHDQYGTETTGRLALAYNPSAQWTFRGTWGQGFKAPSIFQLTRFFAPATEPNPDLKAETSEAFDLGFDFRTENGLGEFGVTFFQQDTTNLVAFSGGSYFNIAKAESTGVEITADYALTDWVSVGLSYANIDATTGDGTPQIRIPEHSGDLNLSFTPAGRLSGALLVRYNGEEPIGATDLDAWTRVDLSGKFAVNEKLSVFARVENLLDEEYQQILGYGTPGISGSIGARIQY